MSLKDGCDVFYESSEILVRHRNEHDEQMRTQELGSLVNCDGCYDVVVLTLVFGLLRVSIQLMINLEF